MGHEIVTAPVCDGIADVLDTVARLTREAAEAGAAASVSVGEAQRHAENLVEILGAAGMWDKMDSEQNSNEKKKEKRSEAKQEKDEDSSDEEKEPWQEHVECVDLFQKLNSEVLTLQQ